MKPLLHDTGFSLVELLLSMLFLSFGLLLYARMQIEALRYNQAAYHTTLAENQAMQMTECLRAFGFPACQAQLAEWQKANALLLSAGKGEIRQNGGGGFTVQLTWEGLLNHPIRIACSQIRGNTNCLAHTFQLQNHA